MTLRTLRQQLIQDLWEAHRRLSPQVLELEQGLKHKGIEKLTLDHFAVIDLPGSYTGIPVLSQIFSALGYVIQGKDYLPEKQNDFTWMTEIDSHRFSAMDVLPQVVVADFRLDECPPEINHIIRKYAYQAPPAPLAQIQKWAPAAANGDVTAITSLSEIFLHYFSGRDWPLPTTREFYTVKEFNDLLAWVLILGRRPNHFTLSVHLMDQFADLADFNQFVETHLHLELNQEGGKIKGGKARGIAQSSTMGTPQTIQLLDGSIELPIGFVEFVWRYPLEEKNTRPLLWKEYFTGFIAQHANKVIESLY